MKSLGQIVLDYCLSTPEFATSIPFYVQQKDSMSYFSLQSTANFKKYLDENVIPETKTIALATQVQDEVDFRIQTNKEDLYTSAQSKRERGDKVHDFLAKISDIDFFYSNKTTLTKQLDDETISLIDSLFAHEEISSFFKPNELLFSERDILCPDGEIIRPDRVVKINDCTHIIDFKTGKENPIYKSQMEKYKNRLSQLGYTQVKASLIYIETQQIEEI